jgi:dTDP-4-dehydrorhamnose reductase
VSPKRLVIVGARGQLGSQFTRDYREAVVAALDRPDIDITDPATFGSIRQARPDVIVNCAAYTNVDKAESEPELARLVNTEGPANLASLAKELDALLVHISTDYVFDGEGTRPYREDDPTAPLGAYGQTKLEGEEAVAAAGARYLTARTAWLYGSQGPNFILKMLELGRERDTLKVVDDQIGSPTHTKDLAGGVMTLLEAGQEGLFHIVNSGRVSRYDLVKELFRLADVSCRLESAKTSDFPTPAARPLYSVLSTEKLEAFYRPRPWQEALADYLKELGS